MAERLDRQHAEKIRKAARVNNAANDDEASRIFANH